VEKALVLEVSGDRATVLVAGGEFRQIRLDRLDVHVGQEIALPVPVEQRTIRWPAFRRMRLAAVIAAVLVAVLMPVGYFQFIRPGPVLAYVDVDLNPNLELGIEAWGRVVEARGIGQDGEAVLQGVSWRGNKVDTVISEVVRVSKDKGYVTGDAESYVLITVTPKDRELPRRLDDTVSRLAATVSQELKAKSIQTPVKVFRGDSDLKKKAEQLGLTPGKVALLVEAIESGVKISPEDVKSERITKAIPKAGGKLDDLLSKAEQRKTWAKLLEKHKDVIDRRDDKKDTAGQERDAKPATPASKPVQKPDPKPPQLPQLPLRPGQRPLRPGLKPPEQKPPEQKPGVKPGGNPAPKPGQKTGDKPK